MSITLKLEASAALRALVTFTSLHTQQHGVLAVATLNTTVPAVAFGALGILQLEGREHLFQFPIASLDTHQTPKFGLEPKQKNYLRTNAGEQGEPVALSPP